MMKCNAGVPFYKAQKGNPLIIQNELTQWDSQKISKQVMYLEITPMDWWTDNLI